MKKLPTESELQHLPREGFMACYHEACERHDAAMERWKGRPIRFEHQADPNQQHDGTLRFVARWIRQTEVDDDTKRQHEIWDAQAEEIAEQPPGVPGRLAVPPGDPY